MAWWGCLGRRFPRADLVLSRLSALANQNSYIMASSDAQRQCLMTTCSLLSNTLRPEPESGRTHRTPISLASTTVASYGEFPNSATVTRSPAWKCNQFCPRVSWAKVHHPFCCAGSRVLRRACLCSAMRIPSTLPRTSG